MKKCLMVLAAMLLLTGCAQQRDYETVMDPAVEQVKAEKQEMLVSLPGEAARSVMTLDNGEKLYFCENYTVSLQTKDSGDLQKTVLEVSGFYPEELSLVETVQAGARRYDFVWSCAGENGDEIGRCAILDDGSYHYIVTAMADDSISGDLTEGAWREIFRSFRIMPAEEVVSSGS